MQINGVVRPTVYPFTLHLPPCNALSLFLSLCLPTFSLEMHAYQSEIMKLKNRQTRLHYHGTVKMTFALLQRSATHYSMYPTPSGLEIQISLCNILGNICLITHFEIQFISTSLCSCYGERKSTRM